MNIFQILISIKWLWMNIWLLKYLIITTLNILEVIKICLLIIIAHTIHTRNKTIICILDIYVIIKLLTSLRIFFIV